MSKRAFDLLGATLGLVLLAPLLILIALWIRLDSRGPVLYRQQRVGRGGRLFTIYKFRTMAQRQVDGPELTVGADPRVTRAGRFLRHYKLDELPQLWNVVEGSMSLVGPRPEVPRYVDCYPLEQRRLVLSVVPGITDWAAIRYKDENAVLARAADPERAYVESVLPVKLDYYVRYVRERTFWGDIRILAHTLAAIVR
ncbi:sugar transferase [Massilia sp. IC2-476]|uniref:sugar transferase n=1 Tax=Massilia sp. IC2-476 TaxID=2887199 RepID=UPI001D1232D1|nr:sugar transferase [Massilia sp. IC2-476]MCC2972432.1 sugar transferase [Massilia sp. IC2-476]